jgi:hypothetical protein
MSITYQTPETLFTAWIAIPGVWSEEIVGFTFIASLLRALHTISEDQLAVSTGSALQVETLQTTCAAGVVIAT